MHRSERTVVIIGGGPAGLTAAYDLCRQGVHEVVLLEKDDVLGGLSRTVAHKGYHFDIGGHRFYTKVSRVDRMWREILGEQDFLRRSRLSRIYYNRTFFYYPLRAFNALRGLGPWDSVRILASYARARAFPVRDERTFEDWVCNRFGRRLYETFFRTYTEKVWGIPCREITAEWAAQRIKGLSLLSALKHALAGQPAAAAADSEGAIKSLIGEFDYPRRGPGMLWERVAERIEEMGGTIHTNIDVDRIHHSGDRIHAVGYSGGAGGGVVEGTDFISTMPMRTLVECLVPAAPASVAAGAACLHYRDFITVALIIDKERVFDDNWIYIHDPDVQVGRIQNFKNWSADMVPDARKTCLGLEYFCFEGDGLWRASDADLLALATRELGQLGLVDPALVEDGAVVRVPKAYPVYDSTYREGLERVKAFLAPLRNLQLVGRNGMHKYNNQDHSMLSAMLAVENILGADHDLWRVNADEEYLEEDRSGTTQLQRDLRELAATQPRVPARLPVS